jgi:hypothetical protein
MRSTCGNEFPAEWLATVGKIYQSASFFTAWLISTTLVSKLPLNDIKSSAHFGAASLGSTRSVFEMLDTFFAFSL